MKNLNKLIKAEMLMLYGEIKHYFFNYIFYNLGIIIMFVGIIKDFNFKSDAALQITALISWHIIASSLSYLCDVIQDEAVMGTLEHLFLTKTNILKIFISKVIVNIVFTMLKASIMFILCFLIFLSRISEPIHPSFFLIVFIVELVIASFGYSIGLLMGGLALYFKRISSFVQVITNILLFFSGILINIPKTEALYYIIPVPSAMNIIKGALYGGIDGNDILIFLINIFIYIVISIFIFNKLMLKTKYDGILGHY